MPIRTSTVVAGGIALLTLVGVTTIFGNSIVAMVAPPPTEGISNHETATTTGGVVGSDPKPPPSAASAPVMAPIPTSGAPVDAR